MFGQVTARAVRLLRFPAGGLFLLVKISTDPGCLLTLLDTFENKSSKMVSVKAAADIS